MKSPLITSVLASFLVDWALADGFVSFPITKGKGIPAKDAPPKNLKFSKILSNIPAALGNMVLQYNINFELGTPAQSFSAAIDTGSSDLWVVESSNPYCVQNGINNVTYNPGDEIDCSSIGGFFTSAKSSTYEDIRDDFYIQYGDYTFAQGAWATDVLHVGSAVLNNFTFGDASETNSSAAVFGVGYTTNEASNFVETNYFTYNNLPVALKQQGLTESVAYSLYLNDIDSDEGAILFGAVDHDKYVGQLFEIPIVNPNEGLTWRNGTPVPLLELVVDVNQVDINLGYCGNTTSIDTVTSEGPLIALLDSGTSFSILPSYIAQPIVNALNATLEGSEEEGYVYVADCSIASNPANFLSFYFSGVPVKVDLRQFLISNSTFYSDAIENACIVGIDDAGSNDNNAILGDTFLRGVYAVFDLESNSIALAEANYNSTSTNIENISNGIPSALAASSVKSTISCPSTSTATSASSSTASSNLTVTSGSASSPSKTGATSGHVSVSLSALHTVVTPSAEKSFEGVATVVSGRTITIPCSKCTEAATTAASSAPTAESSIVTVISGKTVTVPCSETAATAAESSIVTVISGKTVTVPCSETTATHVPATKAAESSTVTVISGKTVTVPCSEAPENTPSGSSAYPATESTQSSSPVGPNVTTSVPNSTPSTSSSTVEFSSGSTTGTNAVPVAPADSGIPSNAPVVGSASMTSISMIVASFAAISCFLVV